MTRTTCIVEPSTAYRQPIEAAVSNVLRDAADIARRLFAALTNGRSMLDARTSKAHWACKARAQVVFILRQAGLWSYPQIAHAMLLKSHSSAITLWRSAACSNTWRVEAAQAARAMLSRFPEAARLHLIDWIYAELDREPVEGESA